MKEWSQWPSPIGVSRMPGIKLSIITATYNAAEQLPRLIDSLLGQTDQDFEWIVADGESTDGTLEMLERVQPKFRRLIVDSRRDFGIYDALNRAIQLARGDYYVTLGADDLFYPDAVKNYKSACAQSFADFVTAQIETERGVLGKSQQWRKQWLYGPFAKVSGHAVGLAVKRALHEKLGWYSKRLPIAADQLFILSALNNGASVVKGDFIAGFYNSKGTSGTDTLGTMLEGYRARLMAGESLWLQTVLLILRIIKNNRRIAAQKN